MAGQQPISYKTVPNRNKTQKWQQAKTYNYDGDEWGGYGEYDDGYGGQQQAPAPPQPEYAQSQNSRMQRPSSFDTGDETTTFNTGMNQDAYGQGSPARSMDSGSRRREFSNPTQVPAPLQMRGSPAPTGDRFPPRKSSLSSSAPNLEPATANDKAPATDKPLPFVRPSDIYKRMAEEKEKERQSMESSRPSMESAQRETTSPLAGRKSMETTTSGRRPSLGSVDEVSKQAEENPPVPAWGGRSSVSSEGEGQKQFQGFSVDNPVLARALGANVATSPLAEQASSPSHLSAEPSRPNMTSPSLPFVSRVSGFGTDFIRGVEPSTPAATQQTGSTSEPWAERQTPLEGGNMEDQQREGVRSAVDHAFDRPDDDRSAPVTPISRHNSQSIGDGSGVRRSDTNSTAGISPIMSRVPSAATAQLRQTDRDANVPTITEEASPISPRGHSRPSSGAQQIPYKPSPGHSRNTSGEVARADRASWNTPGPNNSPARTPALEDAGSRRVSAPMAAETFPVLETPGATDQEPGMALQPSGTPASEVGELGAMSAGSALSSRGRGRSGTDYSKRESDIAEDLNAVNNDAAYSPEAAEQERETQREFLRLHTTNTSQPGSPATPGMTSWGQKPPPGNAYGFPGFQRSTTPGSMASGRAESPAKSRVREIAGKYNDIDDASRRNSAISAISSKSSWSNFRGSQENLAQVPAPLGSKQSGLQAGMDGSEGWSRSGSPEHLLPKYGNDGAGSGSRDITPTARPQPHTEPSFRPHLPGEWVSFAPTPATEEPSATEQQESSQVSDNDRSSSTSTPRGMPTAGPDETIDLTPTTNKKSILGHTAHNDTGSGNPLSAVKGAGDVLGAALVSGMGLGHQTQDFASTEPPAPVEQPESSKALTGELYGETMRPLQLQRFESDTGTNVTSAASSVPPTPPAKDTPKMPSEFPGDEANGVDRPISGYFSKPAKPSPLNPNAGEHRDSTGNLRPTILPTFSTDTHASDLESDRLRRDIVRSLDPERRENMKRESILEDQERTQDALDAPENARRVQAGEAALPAAETLPVPTVATEEAPNTPHKPGMLDQRFSWENKSPSAGRLVDPNTLATPSFATDPNAIAPEQPYERPRSKQGLHIVNPNASDFEDEPETLVAVREPTAAEQGTTSALPVGATAAVGAGAAGFKLNSFGDDREIIEASDEAGKVRQADPAPIDGSGEDDVNDRTSHIPSYYGGALDSPGLQQTTSQQSSTANEDIAAPIPPSKDESKDPVPDTSNKPTQRQSSGGRIPPFREILAIKDSNERVAAYDSTRRTFANTNTGLATWLNYMLESNAQYAGLNVPAGYQPPALQSSTLGRIQGAGHKHSPSIMKYANRFGSNDGTRRASAGASDPAQASSSDTQARGKDIMKSATVLGGKAGTSAKGWLAKGKSRLGGTRSASGPGADGKVPLASSASVRTAVQRSPLKPAPSSQPPTFSTPVPLSSAIPAVATTPAPVSMPTTPAPTLGVEAGTEDPRSAFPFRDATPVGVYPTQPPTSRTLSSTLSRLRNRSRSRSQSRPRNSGGEKENTNNTAPELQNTMPAMLSGPSSYEPGAAAPGTENWGAPPGEGEKAPPMTPANKERARSPERLGVLPSPGGETLRTMSVADAASPKREEVGRGRVGSGVGSEKLGVRGSREGENVVVLRDKTDEAIVSGGLRRDGKAGGVDNLAEAYLEDLPPIPGKDDGAADTDSEVPVKNGGAGKAVDADSEVSPPVTARNDGFAVPMEVLLSKSPEPVDADARSATPVAAPIALPKHPPVAFQQRPAQTRKFSDRALLPSQQTHIGPSPATGAARVDDKGDVFESQLGSVGTNDGKQSLSKGDAVSVVSVDRESRDELEETGPQAGKRSSSRHSTVSSLGTPDTAIQLPKGDRQSVHMTPPRETLQIGSQGTPSADPSAMRPQSQVLHMSRQGTPSAESNRMRYSQNMTPEPKSFQGTPARGQTPSRPYSYRGSPSPRPMSYMQLGNDPSGTPLQENLQVGTPSRTPPPKLGSYGPPPAAASSSQDVPYNYQHSAYAQAPLYEAEPEQSQQYGRDPFEREADPRQQGTEFDLPGLAPPAEHSPQKMKRRSGLFRNSQNSTTEPGAEIARVAPYRRDNAYYGSDLTQIVSNEPLVGTDKEAEQQSSVGRDAYGQSLSRSGTMQGYGQPGEYVEGMQPTGPMRPPTSRYQSRDPYRDSTFAPTPVAANSVQTPEAPAQPVHQQQSEPLNQTTALANAPPELKQQPTLQKPSRTGSVAVSQEPERKKSRLGRLSSIFGRSNSVKPKNDLKRESSAAPKPGKLQKPMPQHERDAQIREHQRLQQQRMRQFQYQQQMQYHAAHPPQSRPNRRLSGYEAYEAARRQHIPDLRGNVSIAEDGPQPPLMISSPYQQQPQQQYVDPNSAMGSHVYQKASPPAPGYHGPPAQDPRAMSTSPVYHNPPPQGYYGGVVQPTGYAEPVQWQQQPQPQQHRRLHSAGARPPGVYQSTEVSQDSYAATVGLSPSAQIMGSYPAALAQSPPPEESGFAYQRQQSFGTQGYRQQAPTPGAYNPGPPSQGMASIDNEVIRDPGQQSANPQPQWPSPQQQQPTYSSNTPTSPGSATTALSAVYLYPTRQSYDQNQSNAGAYPQQQQTNYMPPSGPPPQQQQQQHNRYYARPSSRPQSPAAYGRQQTTPMQYQQGSYDEEEARPMASNRASSGSSGRRDDRAGGEAALEMRGASYPGQEWAPGRG